MGLFFCLEISVRIFSGETEMKKACRFFAYVCLSAGMLYPQVFAQQAVPHLDPDGAQEISDFENSRREWQREKKDQIKLLSEKEARLEDIKRTLLRKIDQFKSEREQWIQEKRLQAEALKQREEELERRNTGQGHAEKLALQEERTRLEALKRKLESDIRKAAESSEMKDLISDWRMKVKELSIQIEDKDATIHNLKNAILDLKKQQAKITAEASLMTDSEKQLLVQKEREMRALEDRLAKERQNLEKEKLEIAEERAQLLNESDKQKALYLQERNLVRRADEVKAKLNG